jgi:hypothetical protein
VGAVCLRAVGEVEGYGFGVGVLAEGVDGFIPLEND